MSWIVFSYSLPSKARSSPRVAVWRRLRALGAISPKGGVHVLPAREECVEAFQWLAQEVEQARGEALLLRVERFEGISDAQLIELFQAARKREYDALNARVTALERSLGKRKREPRDLARARDLLARLRREHAETARVDFFESPAGARLAARLMAIEHALAARRPPGLRVPAMGVAELRNKKWVTRPRPHVDRLACIWLIRRFINPRAAVRYSTTPEPDEIAFDMSGAQFGHRGALCTFETMIEALGLDDPGLRALAEIVHEIDLRDGQYARPETAGIDAVLRGWLTIPDAEREAHGVALFEGLYGALRQTTGTKATRSRR